MDNEINKSKLQDIDILELIKERDKLKSTIIRKLAEDLDGLDDLAEKLQTARELLQEASVAVDNVSHTRNLSHELFIIRRNELKEFATRIKAFLKE